MDLKPVALSNGAAEASAPELEAQRRLRPRQSAKSGDAGDVQRSSGPETPVRSPEENPKASETLLEPVDASDTDNPAFDELLGNPQFKLSFRVDDATKQVVVSVIDPETDDVIRQIPPEEMLRLAEKLDSTRGSLVSSKV